MATGSGYRWWQRGTIYHVYPRSFMDTNGDGIGDLPGITAKLDYLNRLGVDAVWISPIYPSPMADFGYDVSDYTDIDPIFGTLEQFDVFVAEAHRRDLKVILDFVPNHSSDRHPWFLASRTSRDNPKRDWYIWRDPAPDGGPPNNWLSVFGGGAWERDARTGQYYLHTFLKEQPDLNWRNPDVERAMLDVLRFWLERGVDGFRLDAVWYAIKDDQFRDNPLNPAYEPHMPPFKQHLEIYNSDRPEIHEVLAKMRRVLEAYDDRMMIAEIYLPVERLVAYYGVNGGGAHLPFNFQLLLLPWDAPTIAAAIADYEAKLPPDGWPNWVLSNHDNPRIASRVGLAQARVAAMLLLTLRGTPTIYYGDEIGMQDVPIPPELAQDPREKNTPGLGLNRDPARTPMQWDDSPNAGFTTATPWLPVADDYRMVNVAREWDDPASMLSLYRRLLALRRAEPALAIGSYTPVPASGSVLAYLRAAGDRRFLIVLNLSAEPQTFRSDEIAVHGEVVIATHADRDGTSIAGPVELRGDEGLVIAID